MRLLFLAAACSSSLASDDVRLLIDGSRVLAETSTALTSVTIDVCALKQGLDFSDPLLVALSAHLAPCVLRIGGTDQNTFDYDVSSDKPRPTGCACHEQCTMSGAYWASIHRFLAATNLTLLFGLSPQSADNANSLVFHTAHQNYSRMYGYSYGNEQTGDASLAARYLRDMTQVRAALFEAYGSGPHESSVTARPLLIGADTGVGPRKGTTPATIGADAGINSHLAWVKTFAVAAHSVLDALSWHTYDFRTSDFGGADHEPLPWPPTNPNVSRLHDAVYWDVGGRLADNVSAIVAAVNGSLPVLLTETNSICHQGVYNVSDEQHLPPHHPAPAPSLSPSLPPSLPPSPPPSLPLSLTALSLTPSPIRSLHRSRMPSSTRSGCSTASA